jgi:hypothetical protein
VTALQRSGDHILATCDVRIRGIGSGAEVATTLYLLFKFRAHRVLRLAIYFQRTEALAAATLTTS